MFSTTIVPSHTIAQWLLANITRLLTALGLGRFKHLEQILYFVIILGVAIFIGWLLKRFILIVSQKMVKIHNSPTGQNLLHEHTLTKCSHIIPPLVFLSLVPFAFDAKSELLTIIVKGALVYLCAAVAIAVNAILTFSFLRYNDKENTKNLPIKGVLNIAKGIVWLIVVIVAVSIVVDKSPAALLGGLTAFAAALMLIFKDSILGFVAGIQMSQNDMLHVGDWIVVPNTPANGTVMDVSLTTVKVQNFDNTLVMVPPYTLVSTSFQNWRGMSDSGVRRVAAALYLNPDSISAPSAEQLAALGQKYPELQKFITSMQKDDKTIAWNAGTQPLNGTLETNIGLFRAYMVTYLLNSPMVSKDFDLMVRVQPMSAEGVPLQLYFFAVTTQWESYEGIYSAVMEHAMLATREFGLQVLSADRLTVHTEAAS